MSLLVISHIIISSIYVYFVKMIVERTLVKIALQTMYKRYCKLMCANQIKPNLSALKMSGAV